MQTNDSLLTSDSIQMLISSMTQQGSTPLREIEVERFLNAIARVQSRVPTGVPSTESGVTASGSRDRRDAEM